MAIANLTINVIPPPIEGDWVGKSMTSADVTSAEELLAAVAGKSHYIRRLVISCGTNSATISLGSGETTGALTSTQIGPISFSASTAHPFVFDFSEKAMKIAEGVAFVIDGVTAAPVWIYFEFKTV
jgi:hypothetical protein